MKQILLIILILLFSACSKGPNSQTLQKQVDVKLGAFQNGLFKINDFSRRGSYTYSNNGPHLLVYFKMEIELQKDYQFGNWNQLGANSLITALGTSESGIQGIDPKGNKKGDKLTVYGSNNYRDNNGKWIPTMPVGSGKAVQPQEGFVSDIDAQEKLQKGQRANFIKYLDELKTLSKELNKVANQNKDKSDLAALESRMKDLIVDTQIKVDAAKEIKGIGTASVGGEYYQFGKTIENTLSDKKTKYKSYATRGSLSNVQYVANKDLTFGVAQGDLLFEQTKYKSNLKAIMTLFPEAIHIVTLRDSKLNNVEELKGKKINLGQIGSGSHFHAKMVLDMHDVELNQITPSYKNLSNALADLKTGNIDVVMFTGAYPFRPLLNFVKETPIKLLKLSKEAIREFSDDKNITLTIPKNTYPGLSENILVAGSSAVLFTHKDTPKDTVKELLKNLFNKQEELAAKHKRAAKFSKANKHKGILLDIHPGAKEFFK